MYAKFKNTSDRDEVRDWLKAAGGGKRSAIGCPPCNYASSGSACCPTTVLLLWQCGIGGDYAATALNASSVMYAPPHTVQFIEAWRPLAAWVRANEPGTLAYEAMVANTDPLKVLVFER